MTALRTSVFRQNQFTHRYDDAQNDWDLESDGCSNDSIRRTVQLLRMIVSAMLMPVLLNRFLNIVSIVVVVVVVVVVAVACCGSCCCYCSCSCSAVALAAAVAAAAFWSVAIDVVKVGLVPCRIVQSKVVFIVW